MKLFTYICTLIFLSGFTGTSIAVEKIYSVDNLSKNAFRWAQYTVKRYHGKPVPQKWAETLKKAVLADNRVDEGEQRLISLLADRDYSEIKISARKSPTFNPNDIIFSNAVTDEAKVVIESILPKHYDDPLVAKLHSGQDGFASLVRLYTSSAANKQKVIKLYVNYFEDCWAKSHYKDGFSLMKRCISKEVNKASALHGMEYKIGKQLIYEGVYQADVNQKDYATSGAIPDPYYIHLKPEGK